MLQSGIFCRSRRNVSPSRCDCFQKTYRPPDLVKIMQATGKLHKEYLSINDLLQFGLCCNLTKGYWMRNNQNGGWKWNWNHYNICKIQYSPAAWRWSYLVSIIWYLLYVSQTGRVRHKAFLKVGPNAWASKMPRAQSAFP